jgi:hypothetical protein
MPDEDESDNILRNANGELLLNVNGEPMQGHARPTFIQMLNDGKPLKIRLLPDSAPLYVHQHYFVKNKTYIDHKTACRIFPHLPPIPGTRWDALEFE